MSRRITVDVETFETMVDTLIAEHELLRQIHALIPWLLGMPTNLAREIASLVEPKEGH